MRDLRAVFEGLARGHPDNICLRHLLLARCSLTAEVSESQQNHTPLGCSLYSQASRTSLQEGQG